MNGEDNLQRLIDLHVKMGAIEADIRTLQLTTRDHVDLFRQMQNRHDTSVAQLRSEFKDDLNALHVRMAEDTASILTKIEANDARRSAELRLMLVQMEQDRPVPKHTGAVGDFFASNWRTILAAFALIGAMLFGAGAQSNVHRQNMIQGILGADG